MATEHIKAGEEHNEYEKLIEALSARSPAYCKFVRVGCETVADKQKRNIITWAAFALIIIAILLADVARINPAVFWSIFAIAALFTLVVILKALKIL